MHALALIQTLTGRDACGFWGPPKRPGVEGLARRLGRWLDRRGAAVGAIVVVLTFIGALDLVKHAVALF
jgi:hypothetical protein